MSTRIESDLLGSIALSSEALYGAQTERALANFPAGAHRTIGSYPTVVCALLRIKKAAAQVNGQLGLLSPEVTLAIVDAVESLLADPPTAHFPVHYLAGGGGTSPNMNANEVIANVAEELLGGQRGQYRLIHPNDHVNLNQSSNDVYPTACHVAIIDQWAFLRTALTELAQTIRTVGHEFQEEPHLARTCFQDAVDVRFSDYLGGLASFVERRTGALEMAVESLHAVNLGGTICGRAEDVPPGYLDGIVPALALVTGDAGYRAAGDLFDAAQNPDRLVAVSAGLDTLARGLIKIAKDLRILSSGPEAGLGEIQLPPVQPGSSSMPGKVNPVLPESLLQVCLRVMGNHGMCAAALDHGELDLNVWDSAMVFPILESMELLQVAVDAFAVRCVRGLRPNPDANRLHANTIVPRLTRLAHAYGYARVTEVCRQAGGDLGQLKILLDEEFKDGI